MSSSQEGLCPLFTNQSQSLFTVFALMTTSVVIISMVLAFQWLMKRNQFPLKERSTYLSLQFIAATTVSILTLPMIYMQYEISHENFNRHKPMAVFFKLLFQISRGSQTFIQMIKVARIYMAFEHNLSNRWITRVFANELYLAVVAFFLIFFFYGLIPFIDFCAIQLPYEDIQVQVDRGYCGQQAMVISQQVMTSHNIIEIILAIFMVFFLRNVKGEQKAQNEIIAYAVLISFCFQTRFQLSKDALDQTNHCGIASNAQITIHSVKGIMLMVISILQPIAISSRVHYPLTPQLILDDFDKFLTDDDCLQVFSKYLIYLDGQQEFHLSERDSTIQVQNYLQRLLVFWIDQRVVLLKQSQDLINFTKTQFIDQESTIFPLEIRQQVRSRQDSKGEELAFSLFQAQEYAARQLEKVQRDGYMHTVSYRQLCRLLNFYERANKNMLRLNMSVVVHNQSREHELQKQ